MAADYPLEVGSVKGTDQHWIGVDPSRFEPITSSKTRDRLATIKIDRADIPWLIKALQKELTLVKSRKPNA